MTNNIKNYYEVLELTPKATQEEILSAYNRAKNAYTGDSLALYSLMSQDEARKILDLIEEAFTILSSPEKRTQYNEARGIVTTDDFTANDKDREVPAEFKKPVKDQADVNKLIAQKRYGLDYEVDESFELEIEQCPEYSGEFLKKIREYKNVDIPRLADMTKISKTYIRYIEDDDIKKMPALVYVRGFVYQYAKCLKLNPDLVSNSYIYHIKKLRGEA